MPKYLATRGDSFSVDLHDRSYNGVTTPNVFRVDGDSGDVNIKSGKLKVDGTTGVVTRDGSVVPVAGNFLTLVLAGVAAAGPVTATGAVVGDKVIAAVNLTDATNAVAAFEATVTVANQIQQSSASDLHLKTHLFILVHQS